MSETQKVEITPIRFEEGGDMIVAGSSADYSFKAMEKAITGIPNQWQRFAPRIGKIPDRTGNVSYGVTYDVVPGESFQYLCGVEVSSIAALPDDLDHIRLKPHRYAVFAHTGHVSGIRDTIDAIFHGWLPQSNHRFADGADFYFERYGEEYDAQTGTGGFEICVPVGT